MDDENETILREAEQQWLEEEEEAKNAFQNPTSLADDASGHVDSSLDANGEEENISSKGRKIKKKEIQDFYTWR